VEQLKSYEKSSVGLKLIRQAEAPILDKKKTATAKILPASMVKTFEPVLQSAVDFRKVDAKQVKKHFDDAGNPLTVVAFIIHSLKLVAPRSITSFFELFLAIWIFSYILILVWLFKVDGFGIVNRPQFSSEYQSIHKITGPRKKRIEESKKDM
jgi:hypothetical protein